MPTRHESISKLFLFAKGRAKNRIYRAGSVVIAFHNFKVLKLVKLHKSCISIPLWIVAIIAIWKKQVGQWKLHKGIMEHQLKFLSYENFNQGTKNHFILGVAFVFELVKLIRTCKIIPLLFTLDTPLNLLFWFDSQLKTFYISWIH